jgi:ABC-type uncharacterized transport system ATPase subunit
VLEGQGDFEGLTRLPGVVSAHVTTAQARLELDDRADPSAILKRAVDVARLSRFEIQRPDLQEIFVRLVGADQQVDVGDHNDEAGARGAAARRTN